MLELSYYIYYRIYRVHHSGSNYVPRPCISPDPSSGAAELIQASLDVVTKSLEAVVYRLGHVGGVAQW